MCVKCHPIKHPRILCSYVPTESSLYHKLSVLLGTSTQPAAAIAYTKWDRLNEHFTPAICCYGYRYFVHTLLWILTLISHVPGIAVSGMISNLVQHNIQVKLLGLPPVDIKISAWYVFLVYVLGKGLGGMGGGGVK